MWKRLTYITIAKSLLVRTWSNLWTSQRRQHILHVSTIKNCEHAVITHTAQVENSITLVNARPEWLIAAQLKTLQEDQQWFHSCLHLVTFLLKHWYSTHVTVQTVCCILHIQCDECKCVVYSIYSVMNASVLYAGNTSYAVILREWKINQKRKILLSQYDINIHEHLLSPTLNCFLLNIFYSITNTSMKSRWTFVYPKQHTPLYFMFSV